jgi:Flp pilus assembly protein TadG
MFRSNQKGVASVEFAIVIPILILLICGTIEFGLLFYNKQVLANASREAVRAGITGVSNTNIEQIAINYCSNRLIGLKTKVTPDLLFVNITAPDSDNDLTVTVGFNYQFLFAQIIGVDQVNLSGQTVMRMEPLSS